MQPSLSSPGALAQNAVVGLIVLAFLWLGFRWFERANIYIPSRTLTAHPGTYGLKYEDLKLSAADGTMLHGWFIPRGPQDLVILVCHGNAGNISHRMDKALIFRKAGASVLLFDYRGYGQSSGRPSEMGTYEDAEAAYRTLTETLGIALDRIIFYGESLGCGVALELALRHPPAGLILDSGFTSIADMGREIFPWLPLRRLLSISYDNRDKIGRLKAPLLVMHSPSDDIVPYRMGREIFDLAPEPKVFFEMKGDHNEGFYDTGAAYGDAIGRFLAESSATKR